MVAYCLHVPAKYTAFARNIQHITTQYSFQSGSLHDLCIDRPSLKQLSVKRTKQRTRIGQNNQTQTM